MWNTWEDDSGLGAVTAKKQAKRSARAAGQLEQWKAAGSPESWTPGATGGGWQAPPQQPPMTTLPAPDAPLPEKTTPTDDGGGLFDGIGNFFSSVPKEYLMIGGAVVLFMMLKKR